jgi:two-component system, OmpR family, KDP operon response regulator KdpE
MQKWHKVLVIDDELQIRRFLKMSLETYGYNVFEASSGNEGLIQINSVKPDIVLLDLGLPDIDGKDLLKKIREWTNIPVIILTVKDSEQDKIELLDTGADDYLTKPFGVGELQSRIKVALRHSHGNVSKDNIFRTGKLVIDYSNRIVTLDKKEIKFTPTEYSFLCLLAKNAGKVVTQTQIMREIWNPNLENETQYLRIYVLQLRRKLETDPSNPKMIITEPGVGYRLIAEDIEKD